MNWRNDFNRLSILKDYVVYICKPPISEHLKYTYQGEKRFCKYNKDKDVFVEKHTGKIIEKKDVSAFKVIDMPPQGFISIIDNAKVCEKCNGEGQVKKTYVDKQAGIRDEWTGKCTFCQGLGYIEND